MTSSELFGNYRSNSSLKYCFGILNTISFLTTIIGFKDEENWRQFKQRRTVAWQHILFKTNLFWKLHRWRFRKEAIVSGRIVPENRINRIMICGSGIVCWCCSKGFDSSEMNSNKENSSRIAELRASEYLQKKLHELDSDYFEC
jgi:hypothetical protein